MKPMTSIPPRRTEEISRQESLRLLGTVSFGRIVFTLRALPAVRPVNHLVDERDIIIRTSYGAALAPAASEGVVVAYEVDDIDPELHLGWSVIVTGIATPVTSAEDEARYRRALRPWVEGRRDLVIRIQPTFVTGLRLVDGDAPD